MSLDFNKLAASPLQSGRLNPEFRLVPIIKGQTKDICTFFLKKILYYSGRIRRVVFIGTPVKKYGFINHKVQTQAAHQQRREKKKLKESFHTG